jgi:hypothetical protein
VQTWYADDAGAAGKFNAIKQQFAKLQEFGKHFGYYPEPTKSILIASHEQQQHSRTLALLSLRASAILALSLVRRILVIAGFRRKSHVWRKGSRSLPPWPIPTHSLPMQVCRSRYSSDDSLYREWSTELVKVSPRVRKQLLNPSCCFLSRYLERKRRRPSPSFRSPREAFRFGICRRFVACFTFSQEMTPHGSRFVS